MKSFLKNFIHISAILSLLFLISLSSCKEELISPNPDNGSIEVDSSGSAIAESFETYAGDIGIELDLRDLARKSYNPTSVFIKTSAKEANHDKEVEIDAFTSLAVLSISVESLSEEAEAELRDGVEITVDIKNANDQIIHSETFGKTSFKTNENRLIPATFEMEDLGTEVAFKEGMPYFLQIVFTSGNLEGRYKADVAATPRNREDNALYRVFTIPGDPPFDYGKFKTYAQFYFQKIPNETNVYAIYSAHSKRYLYINNGGRRDLRQSGSVTYPNDFASLRDNFKFRIQKSSGLGYTFQDMQGNFLGRTEQTWKLDAGIAQFRIIALDIDWEVELIETRDLKPILPAAQTSFGFNSTLKNCASGTLEQEVGIEVSETTTFSASYEESIGFASRTTASIGASATATAEASFFGSGGSVSGTVEASLEVSTEASQTSTRGEQYTSSKTQTYFSKRTVSVPSGKASLVYDAYQTYSNVRVPFVQKFRIKGKHDRDNSALTGPEIATQYHFSSGKGLIAEVGSDYIEVYVRGASVLDNILDTKSEVRDVAVDCGN